ncbi:MAG: 3-hydroxyacyl-CoA dehydrogenase NAD-binding domain-containing protein, partial [Planctomycetota bacterium]|nr:3-hydroxyacyl-CoA dehydrogenase NAD-binding domain-containing protein [Planctomycetota bacterium]
MNKADEIETAAVIGAGTMGSGIAQVLAMCGIATRLYDVAAGPLDKALALVRANLDKGVEKGKVEASVRDAALERLSVGTDLDAALEGAQAVIEAVPEKLELKRDLFTRMGDALGPEVLLATNTSSL